jgi:phage major head subunit gpT-like protein
MDISFPNLQTLNNSVNARFNEQLYTAPSIYKLFSLEVESTGDSEVYPRLDMLGGLRRWLGERVVNSLSLETFSITNETFEETIGVRREQIEDDKYTLLGPAAGQLGQDAAVLPDKLIATLLKNGNAQLAVDGQNFFSTTHMAFPNTVSTTTISNYQAGSGNPSWYLIDNSHVLKPFIFQTRRPFAIIPRFSLTDPNVFDKNEFQWGTDGRCAAGYGLYQLIYRSDAVLNQANLLAARAAMAAWKRPDGSPMGITPTHLVVPSSLYPTARAYCERDYDPLLTSNLTPNSFQGLAKAVENRWIV